ncbi:hypothetical protein BH20ACT23_BH20ACT23_00120 [soil metagenome]
MRRLVSAVALTLALSACAGEVASDTPGRALDSTPDDGAGEGSPSEASDFSFKTFEGEIFSLAEQRGTPVVLNFWESW